MSWRSSFRQYFLALWFFLGTSMMRGAAFVTRLFNASGPLTELPVTTHITSVSHFVTIRKYAQRFVVKPIAKLYNTADNFIYQTYGYVVWNSPRYIAQAKMAFQHIRAIALKYMGTERVPPAQRRPSPRYPSSIHGSPIIVTRDSVWTEWDAQIPLEEANEWTFYIRGCGDRQGMTITQTAWKGYQGYIQQLGLPPANSPSRITVKDFEAYQAAVHIPGRMKPTVPISHLHSAPPSLQKIGCPMSSDTPLSSFSSSGTLLSSFPSSFSSMTTLAQSPQQSNLDAKLGFKDINDEEVDISDSYLKADLAMPILSPWSVAIEDLEGLKCSSRNFTPRKSAFSNLRSINSFGDIEALFTENYVMPASDMDGLCPPSLVYPVLRRHSVTASSSIYSQESAASEDASLVDTPPLGLDQNAVVEDVVYEDDICSDENISIASSDACCQGYLVAPLCDDIVSSEDLSITALDSATSLARNKAMRNSISSQVPVGAKKSSRANRSARIIPGLAVDLNALKARTTSFSTCSDASEDTPIAFEPRANFMESPFKYRESWATYRAPSIPSPTLDASSVCTQTQIFRSPIGVKRTTFRPCAPEYIEEVQRHRVHMSRFAQRDFQQGYCLPALLASRIYSPAPPRYQSRQGIPF